MAVIQFPGGSVDTRRFRTDDGPLRTTRADGSQHIVGRPLRLMPIGSAHARRLIGRAVELQAQVNGCLRDGRFLGERSGNERIEIAAHEAERAVVDALGALQELVGRLEERR